ncbi:hypothetical protein D6833_13180 [Candidatus Parcubacteria bacterium]|nr:MAG: hypothetical protein D6833_13180 [Candidatus Parcubacteria bacterium]
MPRLEGKAAVNAKRCCEGMICFPRLRQARFFWCCDKVRLWPMSRAMLKGCSGSPSPSWFKCPLSMPLVTLDCKIFIGGPTHTAPTLKRHQAPRSRFSMRTGRLLRSADDPRALYLVLLARHAQFLKTIHSMRFLRPVEGLHDNADHPIVVEERTLTLRRGPSPARLLIEFTSKLTAPRGGVTLNGDLEHAGVQYRPANEIVKSETQSFFPADNANPRKDLDYPWVGETYVLRGRRNSVVQMNPPSNPKGTKYSAYRDYGRFGVFFVADLPQGQSLTVRYQFLIIDGEMPAPESIQKWWQSFAND